MLRKRVTYIICLLLCIGLVGCGKDTHRDSDNDTKRESVTSQDIRSEIEDIMPEGTTVIINGDSIEVESQYGTWTENITNIIELIKNNDFKTATIIIHGKNGIGYYELDNGEESYSAEINGVMYESYYEDFNRICDGQHPYIISQEANDLLYHNGIVDIKFYEEYTFDTNGNLIICCDKDVFWNNVATKSYDLAVALFDADEHIMHITFQENGEVNAYNYQREIENEETSIEPNEQTQVELDSDTYAAVINVYNTMCNYMNGNTVVRVMPDDLKTNAQESNTVVNTGMVEAPIQITTEGNNIIFLYDGGVYIIWNTDNDEISIEVEDIYNEQAFTGSYYSDENDTMPIAGSSVEIIKNGDNYTVNINFVRLTHFDNCDAYFSDGFLYFSGEDINGEIVSGEISIPTDGEIMLVFTQSNWDSLDSIYQFMFYK
jgi:hypothetical protein